MATTFIVPGLNGSEPEHWQSWFERHLPNCVRVVQGDWEKPDLPRWSAKLRSELNRTPGRVFIVAHSFGCLAAAQTAFDCRELVAGVMLVAPADPDRFGLGRVVPARSLGVPAIRSRNVSRRLGPGMSLVISVANVLAALVLAFSRP